MRTQIRDKKPQYDPEACVNHAPASGLPTLACIACGTFKWNGVNMCGKVLPSSILAWVPRLRKYTQNAHACTRAKNHQGDCKSHKLDASYVPG